MPPGLEAARNSPAHQARAWGSPARLGAKVSIPTGPPHCAMSCSLPGVILACAQRVRIVRRPAALGQRAEQDEPGHAAVVDRPQI